MSQVLVPEEAPPTVGPIVHIEPEEAVELVEPQAEAVATSQRSGCCQAQLGMISEKGSTVKSEKTVDPKTKMMLEVKIPTMWGFLVL